MVSRWASEDAQRRMSAELAVVKRENELLRQRQSWLEQRVQELEVKLGQSE